MATKTATKTATKRPTTVPVSERALIQRINRKLQHEEKRMMVARSGSRAEQEYGRYFIIDIRRSQATDADCDPEALGREIGALTKYEHLVKED
jgi:hypothetical protein